MRWCGVQASLLRRAVIEGAVEIDSTFIERSHSASCEEDARLFARAALQSALFSVLPHSVHLFKKVPPKPAPPAPPLLEDALLLIEFGYLSKMLFDHIDMDSDNVLEGEETLQLERVLNELVGLADAAARVSPCQVLFVSTCTENVMLCA